VTVTPSVIELDLEADPRAKRVFGDETIKMRMIAGTFRLEVE
jgi:hypothetical protein